MKELLKDYGLRDTQLRIVNALSAKERNARELVRGTGIPIGSIYNILNEMIEMKLVQKIGNKYRLMDLVDFADEQVYRMTKLREDMINNLKVRKQKVLVFNDYIKFKLACVKQDPYPTEVLGLISGFRFPIFFFPKYFEYKKLIKEHIGQKYSKQEEMRNRLNVRKYKELQDVENRWVVNKEEFDIFLKLVEKKYGKNEKKELIEIVKKKKVRLSEEKKDYQFIVTNNTVQFQLRDDPMFIGLIIFDEDTVDSYKNMFELMWKKGRKI